MSQSSNLYRLQQIDSQIDRAKNRIDEIELALSSNPALKIAQEHVKTSEQSYKNAQKVLQKAEESAQDQRIKINQSESMLYSGKVRNPKELQDLQNEVAALKRYLNVLEDRQLEAMLELDDVENNFNQASQQLSVTLATTTEQQAGLRGELTQIMKTSERLDLERKVAISVINPDELELYEQLRLSRRGVAIAKISSQACEACGALLPPALVQAAHSPTKLVRCTSCGRILYAG